ncbi:hypothetical protein F4821DRAFT_108552 [Hypoxylon rubiginosum]|uniref:Uncharacterized protein n=1 Tax=Hypoxylon rubiginosum TaxID=110542 RepID=A0ACC0D3X2_9PEZI|nr:hypothetical protein F4821DRAFT_108552 [Hypoxylon rubiginosum]
MTPLTQGARQNLQACSAMIGLTALAVVSRVAVRLTHGQALQVSDWLCLTSLALFYAQCGLIINFIIRNGAYEIGPPLQLIEIVELLKITWIAEILFGGLITAVKLSILWFYYSIFSVNHHVRHAIFITATGCIIWFIVTTFIVLFQCHPIDAFWNQLAQPPFCIDAPTFLLGYEMTNLFLDVAILCIPTGALKQLHLPLSKKISLCVIFILGGLVCIASIIRLTALYKLPNPDLNFNFPVSLLWGTIQSGLAIICSCLPILGPVFGAVAKASDAVRTWYGSLRSRSSKSKTSHGGGSKASNAAGSGQSWTRFEDSRYIGAAGSWARVDHEDGSENFRLKPMHSGTASSDRDLEQQQYSFLH